MLFLVLVDLLPGGVGVLCDDGGFLIFLEFAVHYPFKGRKHSLDDHGGGDSLIEFDQELRFLGNVILIEFQLSIEELRLLRKNPV